jgi:excisionase family DNA binding protein
VIRKSAERVASQRGAMATDERLLTVAELARYLGVPVGTLYQWRYRSEGPPGFRVGRHVRYRRRDVEKWIRGRLDEEQPR